MSRKYRKAAVAEAIIPNGPTGLPTHEPVAVYYRQSTDSQIGNISTTIQTVDMVSYLKARGWNEDDIIMLDMDAGISGTKKIDERPGMRALFELITEGKVRAVACQDEDRLFRDVTQIQVNIFIEACRQSSVLVLTPSMIYDFANPQLGTFHARQFRFKCEMAAEYINSVIIGKLVRAKYHLLLEGRWAGGAVLPGYMIDTQKTLPDGGKNPNWRRYTPFGPYAEVVNEYFRLFTSTFAGNLRRTLRHIHKHGPFYPDPSTCPPPEGFKVDYRRMHRFGNGLCPGRVGLKELLVNAGYIGHWIHKGVIVRWNNHPSIVPVEVFMKAFNYLSPVTLTGQPNSNYRPFHENTRPSRDENRPVDRPLCAGMIVSQFEGKWTNVGTRWTYNRYVYLMWSNYATDRFVWSRIAEPIDQAIIELVSGKLRATYDSDIWAKTLATVIPSYEKERKQKETQLNALTRIMESQVTSLDALTNPEMIKAVQTRYEEAQAEHKRLTTEIAVIDEELGSLKSVCARKDAASSALENWENLTRDEKRVILHNLVHRIEATPIEIEGLQLRICWRDGREDELTLQRNPRNGYEWSPDEVSRLISLIDAKASQLEVSRALPQRNWQAIKRKAYTLRGRGSLRASPQIIKDRETYEMYQARIGDHDHSGNGLTSDGASQS